jgi:hypothetical protein
MDGDVWICGAVRITPVVTDRSTVHRLGSASLLMLTADTASHVPGKLQVCRQFKLFVDSWALFNYWCLWRQYCSHETQISNWCIMHLKFLH